MYICTALIVTGLHVQMQRKQIKVGRDCKLIEKFAIDCFIEILTAILEYFKRTLTLYMTLQFITFGGTLPLHV